jgi:Xaa-Pro aminopeptidase
MTNEKLGHYLVMRASGNIVRWDSDFAHSPMCNQLRELERALEVASIRRKTAVSALAHESARAAARESLLSASDEIQYLHSGIEQHMIEHGCQPLTPVTPAVTNAQTSTRLIREQ